MLGKACKVDPYINCNYVIQINNTLYIYIIYFVSLELAFNLFKNYIQKLYENQSF